MLLELQRDSQTSVVRHPTIKAVIDQCIGDVDSSSEDLVQVSTQSMGDSVWVHCMSETEEVQLSVHVSDVVVEVTTHHNNRVHILFDDILDDISHSVCSILLELLLTRFKVAVEYLNLVSYLSSSSSSRSMFPVPSPVSVSLCWLLLSRLLHFVAASTDETSSCRDTLVSSTWSHSDTPVGSSLGE
jgi:hypothetical protein